MRLRFSVSILAGIVSLAAQPPTLREAAAKRPLPIGPKVMAIGVDGVHTAV